MQRLRKVRLLLVSRGQTAYFSFDMGAEKNKGLATHVLCRLGCYHVNARMTYKVVLKFVAIARPVNF